MDDLSNLIKRAQEGDRDAFGEIYLLFYKRIFRYCKLNLREAEAAQDICQETFIKAWRAMSSFSEEKGGSLQAFLFKIARNLIIDRSRKKKELKLEEYAEIEEKESFEEKIERKEVVKRVQDAISKLNEIEKQLIILHYFEEMSGAEIARVIGIGEGAVRVRTHRTLAKLKSILGEKE